MVNYKKLFLFSFCAFIFTQLSTLNAMQKERYAQQYLQKIQRNQRIKKALLWSGTLGGIVLVGYGAYKHFKGEGSGFDRSIFHLSSDVFKEFARSGYGMITGFIATAWCGKKLYNQSSYALSRRDYSASNQKKNRKNANGCTSQ